MLTNNKGYIDIIMINRALGFIATGLPLFLNYFVHHSFSEGG